MEQEERITRAVLDDDYRLEIINELFGLHGVMNLENTLFTVLERQTPDYKGGYWEMYKLSNDGFYMAPNDDVMYNMTSENTWEGELSADAAGIATCLYAMSHLSFNTNPDIGIKYSDQYHKLLSYAYAHKEACNISSMID